MSERRMALSIAARLDRLQEGPEPAPDEAPVGLPTHPLPVEPERAPRTPPQRAQPEPMAPALPTTQRPTAEPGRRLACAVCGALNESDVTFCVNCGIDLELQRRTADAHDQPAAEEAARIPAGEQGAARYPQAARPEPTAPAHAELICPNCGTSNPPTRTFCRKCATPLAPAPATPTPRAAPIPAQLSLESLADYITAYIPTWVVALFLPLWGALVAAEAGGAVFGQPVKLAIAIATGLTAGMWVWGEGYRRARTAAAGRRRRRRIRPLDALRVGAWEVTAAAVAAFAWATAAPSSWASFSSAFWPLATVIGATVILGVAGNFVAPLEGES